MTTHRHSVLAAFASSLAVAAPASAQFSEVEPNEHKATATVCPGLVTGMTITGTSLGVSQTAGAPNSRDHFRVSTAPLLPGIYKHRLYLTSSGTFGNQATIRGLGQTNQGAGLPGLVTPGTDASTQSSGATAPAAPQRFLQWYGFGTGEQLYVSVQGSAFTTAPYVLTMETVPVGYASLGTLAPGTIDFRSCDIPGVADIEFHVFDAALNAILDYSNDDTPMNGCVVPGLSTTRPRLIRSYGTGTYYLAVGRYNTATHLRSPADDNIRSAVVQDFAGSILSSNAASATANASFSVHDSAGSFNVPVNIDEPYEILWYRFDVQSGGGCNPVVIATQPVGADVCAGHAAVLQVSATGTDPITYQWRYNGYPIPGATSAELLIASAQFADAGAYDVVVANACGQVSSSPALLSVHPDGPAITDQPDPLVLCPGQDAVFVVSAVDHMGGPLLYQWYENAAPIAGANSPVLQFTVSCTASSAQYSCRVEEVGCGHTDSAPALLTVRNEPPAVTLVGDSIVNIECGHEFYIEPGAFAIDDCEGALLVTIGGDVVNPFQIGEYVVTYTATDCQGNSAVAERHVFVVDTEPPAVEVGASTDVLWSPDHELVNVGLSAQVTDHCDPQGAAENITVEVFCDEIELPDTGDGTGKHSPDAKDIGLSTLRLRSERKGNSNGRVYLVVVASTDASGNVGFGFRTIVCPNGQNQASLDTVSAQAAAVLATAESVAATNPGDAKPIADAIALLGFVEHGLAPENGPHQ